MIGVVWYMCARSEDASLLTNLEQAFGQCISSREDIKREVGTQQLTSLLLAWSCTHIMNIRTVMDLHSVKM